jgi:Na+-transporting NADH:ubiquinone oxidoreductase subunit NqrD
MGLYEYCACGICSMLCVTDRLETGTIMQSLYTTAFAEACE